MKTYILNDTISGVDKHKKFCNICGCTLWTIPMKHGGTYLVVRTALIENGSVMVYSSKAILSVG
jgi:hypothetical protein